MKLSSGIQDIGNDPSQDLHEDGEMKLLIVLDQHKEGRNQEQNEVDQDQ